MHFNAKCYQTKFFFVKLCKKRTCCLICLQMISNTCDHIYSTFIVLWIKCLRMMSALSRLQTLLQFDTCMMKTRRYLTTLALGLQYDSKQ